MNRLKPFKLERYFARHEFSSKYLLSSSDCESWSIAELLAFETGADAALEQQWLGYTESSGSPALRAEIARIYPTLAAEDVLVHSGAEEAILLFMSAALEAGDEVIVHSPCYQALAEIPHALGCRAVPWTAHENKSWALDLAELKSKLNAKTKCIVVNFPHNPTGFLPSVAQFRELARLAAELGIMLFCDEVYRESEHSAHDRLPAACELSDTAVSLGVMSKAYGLAGLRIGWVATKNKRLLERMAELKDYTTICNSAPSENLATLALRHRGKLVQRNTGIIVENMKTLDQFFSRHQDRFSWKRPKAGPIAFPHLLQGNAELFCQRALDKAGVLLLPGSVFGDYPAHFRLGFGRRNLPEALDHLERCLRDAT